MKLKEFEKTLLAATTEKIREAGEALFTKGLVSIKGKKQEGSYYIGGKVSEEESEVTNLTHIKIDMKNKKLQGIKCTCEEFKENALKGHFFMCKHLAGTVYEFFSLVAKKDEKEEAKEEEPKDKKDKNTIVKLTRKMLNKPICYEAQIGVFGDKQKLEGDELRAFLENLDTKNIKYKHEYIEADAKILCKELPLTFTLKDRKGQLLLTTHKQFPIPLTPKNDVFLFNWQLYLPSIGQVDRYMTLYEPLKAKGEIAYNKTIENYNRLLALLSKISTDINISEEIKAFAAKHSKPEFHLYKVEDTIYCEAFLAYGNEKINILKGISYQGNSLRDYKRENRIIIEIEKYGFIKRENRLIFVGSNENMFDILSRRGENLHSIGTVFLGEGFENMKVYDASIIDARLYDDESYIELAYKIEGVEVKELDSMLTAYKLENRFYKTKANNFLDFEDEGFRKFFNLIELLNMNGNTPDGSLKIDKSKALFLTENIRNSGLDFIKGTENLETIEKSLEEIKSMEIKVPKELKGTLREYQIGGFRWLKGLSHLNLGGILADEMGLGKTIQTIAFVLSEKAKKTIIISPTSLIYNWKDEFESFAPTLRVGIVHGEKSDRLKVLERLEDYEVILTTYGTLRMDIEEYKYLTFDYCIIDEGQNIKNSLAQNTRVIKEIKAGVRFALTGTPIENNLLELWSIFDFIMPDFLYTQRRFEEKFINHYEENLESLRLLIRPFILRRTKAEVLKELPDKIEKKFLVEMTTAQKAVYKTYAEAVRKSLDSDNKIEVFAYLTKLRQICLDPSLIVEEYEGGSGKLKVAMELIKDHISTGGKLLLFSQFTSVLSKLGEQLQQNDISFYNLDGSTKSKNRLEMVNQFNASDDTKVFLISLKAGGTGLNLTTASLVIHFDPWWNIAVENQATDRAHRIGQKEAVEVIKLVAKGTIEEKIVLLQEDKKELFSSIITGELKDSKVLSRLSREEILNLFDR